MQVDARFGPAFTQAMQAFDARNAQDPNQTLVNGVAVPKELAYAQRMTEMLQRYRPDASEALQLAARCQHIERWTLPRDAYPMTKPGYHQWRRKLKQYHAEVAREIMQQAGYDEETILRVAALVSKEAPLADAEMQVLEDVVVMVFVEYYLEEFVGQHPEYDVPKWKDILRKTLRKVSKAGHQALLTQVKLPQALVPLIQEVMMEEGWL
ncbi:DUF4202 domain-containing protein [Methylobacillus flagellatus]|uniref:DUF4202 domain-containing protein n=1 Tax=Methylobacillus flagellatus (strain ATCC 51484 / DSM 6875 / VKM B-1610 / KT) TaxID=265072 RepID=Q1GXI5_METFK|nr:DUF4202 domain-containing protein [Methylobacillus flagellatus]ABE48382.1 conserved hypothetical protein [Methylobacillus flagellatus KT]